VVRTLGIQIGIGKRIQKEKTVREKLGRLELRKKEALIHAKMISQRLTTNKIFRFMEDKNNTWGRRSGDSTSGEEPRQKVGEHCRVGSILKHIELPIQLGGFYQVCPPMGKI